MNNLERRRKQSTSDNQLLTSSQKLGMLTNTFIYGGTKTQGPEKRAAMWADPDWITYTQESAKLGALINQENKLMRPVDFLLSLSGNNSITSNLF